MPQTDIVVESGVIQCEHGGKVLLKSSETVMVIGGQKPLHDIDILGAPIQGCPYKAPVGGQCTSVASISSATTESNVGASGINYLLRVDGCQTDKGAALVLNDPGQTSTKVEVKASGSSGDITSKKLEESNLDTKEVVKTEKYRICPLRISGDTQRALRGAREFKELKVKKQNHIHDRVITKTDAYLYVTHESKTTEYKVVNKGDIVKPSIHKVQFKDSKTNIIRRYIPFYEDQGTLKFVYSNIRLSDEQLEKFTPIELKVEDNKNEHILNERALGKSTEHDKKDLKKQHLITAKEAAKYKSKRFSVLLSIEDPVGEVEDLYHDLDTSFTLAYDYNKPLIDKVRENNKYAFGIASFMNNIYLTKDERETNEALHNTLSEAYYTLVRGVKTVFSPYIINTCKDRGCVRASVDPKHRKDLKIVKLNGFIEYDISKEYIEEVKFCATSLLEPIDRLLVFRDYQNDFAVNRAKYGKFDTYVDRANVAFMYIDKNVIEHVYDNTKHKRPKISKTKNLKEFENNSIETMALLVFSLYFSGRHDEEVKAKGTLYQDSAATFFYTLKKLNMSPEFSASLQNDLADSFHTQYSDLFQNANGKCKDGFIEDYEDLETTARFCAFNLEKDTKKHNNKFTTLVPSKETFNFFFDKHIKSPHKIAELLKEKLKKADLKDILDKYIEISLNDSTFERVELLLNMAYLLTASRTVFDTEVTETSPFNKENEVLSFLKSISQKLQSVDDEVHKKLYEGEDGKVTDKNIFHFYHKSLHSIILHALVQGEFNTKEFATRKTNAQDFLDAVAPVTAKEFKEDLSKLSNGNISQDFKIKKEQDKIFEQLSTLDGVTSQLHSLEGVLRSDDAKAEKKNNNKVKDDGLTTEGTKKHSDKEYSQIKKFRDTSVYKVTIGGMKGLSFIVALYSTGKILKDYKSINLKAVLDLAGGVNTIATTVAEAGKESSLLSRNATALKYANKLLDGKFFPQRLLTKLGVPIIIVGAVYEIVALEDDDYDAIAAITAKTAITVAVFFFSGFWIAFAVAAALAIIWYIFSSYVVDSKVQIMVEKSLFFQKDKRQPYIMQSLSIGDKTYLFKGKETSIKDIKTLGSPKDARDFIYNNYASHKNEFEKAACYEFSSIYRVLQGTRIEVHKEPVNSKPNDYEQVNFSGHLLVDKEYYKTMTGVVWLIENDDYKKKRFIEVDDVLTKMDDNMLIDLFAGIRKESTVVTQDTIHKAREKRYTILIDSGATSAKFELGMNYSSIQMYARPNNYIQYNFYLDNLIPRALTDDDTSMINIS